mgnify:CR=1 FL=1
MPFLYWQQLILDQDTVLLDNFHQKGVYCKCTYPSYKRTSRRDAIIHLCRLSFCLTVPGKWKTVIGSSFEFLFQDWGVSGIVSASAISTSFCRNHFVYSLMYRVRTFGCFFAKICDSWSDHVQYVGRNKCSIRYSNFRDYRPCQKPAMLTEP